MPEKEPEGQDGMEPRRSKPRLIAETKGLRLYCSVVYDEQAALDAIRLLLGRADERERVAKPASAGSKDEHPLAPRK